MTLWRRCDVHRVRGDGLQHLRKVLVPPVDPKTFGKLTRHERLAVTNGDHAAAGDSLNGKDMLIGDLSAANYGNTRHR
jgi:hypothetical protein